MVAVWTEHVHSFMLTAAAFTFGISASTLNTTIEVMNNAPVLGESNNT